MKILLALVILATALPLNAQTIDGAKTPNEISDRVAYSLFMRFLSGRTTKVEKAHARSYLQMYLASACDTDALSDTDLDSLLAEAEVYNQKVSALDRRSRDIINPRSLRKQKDQLVDATAAALPARLGMRVAEKVRAHLNDVFKRKVKIGVAPPARPLVGHHASPDGGGAVYTYADAWLVAGTEYDSTINEWQVSDPPNHTVRVAGVGVTEAEYGAGSESVHTALSGPSGSGSVTSYSYPSYSRAELSIEIPNTESPDEVEWTVNTQHVYWQDENQPISSGRRSRPLFFYTLYNATPIFWSWALTAYTNPLYTIRGPFNRGPWGCRYRTRTCDSNCLNSSTWIGAWVDYLPCPPFAQAYYLTWRVRFVARGCILGTAFGRSTPGRCTPRTW